MAKVVCDGCGRDFDLSEKTIRGQPVRARYCNRCSKPGDRNTHQFSEERGRTRLPLAAEPIEDDYGEEASLDEPARFPDIN